MSSRNSQPPRALIDHFNSKPLNQWALDAINKARYSAQRYMFDSAASFRVGELMTKDIALLAGQIEFAVEPYPNTYIQINARDAFRGRGGVADATSDLDVGYLSSNGYVFIFSRGPEADVHGYNTAPSPFVFRLNKPQTLPPEKIFPGTDTDTAKLLKMVWVLGGQRDKKNLKDERINISLPDIKLDYDHFCSRFDIQLIYKSLEKFKFFDFAFQSGGDPMMYATALLLLNRPSDKVLFKPVQASHGIIKGKRVGYYAHTVVYINLAPHESARTLYVAGRASPVGHYVAGHWVNYDKQERCEHEWEPLDTSGKRFKCVKCSQRRTRKETFIRGDTNRGFLVKHYEVHP